MSTGGSAGGSVGRGLVEIELDITELRRQLEEVTNRVDQNVGQQENRFGGLATMLKGSVAGAVAAVGAALVAAGAASVKFAQENLAAQNKFQTQLGVTAEEAAALGDVAKKVFANNFGGSIGEAADGVTTIRREIKGLADEDLQGVTEAAFSIKDAFEEDVGRSAQTVNTLMKNFGLTSKQATDFLTTGFQRGLNASGDFLDSVNEYATQFSNGGMDAGQFFSILETGMQGGALGTDKAADSFKEFRVRIQDGSKTTSESLKLLGIDADDLSAKMASGQVTAAEAYEMVLGKLKGVKDENVLMQAGVGLLGTQFEDLGQKSVLAMTTTKTKIEDMKGATASLATQYNDLPNLFASMGRQFLVSMEPAGAALLKIGNELFPLIQSAAKTAGDLITPIIKGVADAILSVKDRSSPLAGIFDTVKKVGGPALQSVWEALKSLGQVLVDVWTKILQPTLKALEPFFKATFENIGTVIKTVFTVLKNVFDAVSKLLNGDFKGAFESLKLAVKTIIDGIVTLLKNWAGTVQTVLKGFIAKFLQAGKDLIDGVIKGMKAKMGEAVTAVKEVGSNIVTGFKDLLGIKSPSRVMAEQGFWVSAGIAQGITDGAGLVDAAVSNVAGSIEDLGLNGVGTQTTAVTGAVTDMTDEVARQVDAMASKIEQIAGILQQNFLDIFNGVVSAQQGLANVLAQITDMIVQSIVQQIIAQQAALIAQAIISGASFNFVKAGAMIAGAAALGALVSSLTSGARAPRVSSEPGVPTGGADQKLFGSTPNIQYSGTALTLDKAATKMLEAAQKMSDAIDRGIRVDVATRATDWRGLL